VTVRLLDRIEHYYDAVPRPAATVEQHGPFTLFVATGAWPYYARPRLGANADTATAHDIGNVLARQHELGVPQAFECVDEITPGLTATAASAGLEVDRYPLLSLDAPLEVAPVPGVAVSIAQADDPAIPAARAAIDVGFGHGGTAAGAAGISERDAAIAASDGVGDAFVRSRIADGLSVMAVANSADGPVGGGTASPIGSVAELMGIATLPAYRRRGIGLAITAVLTAEVRRLGISLVFLSAGDDDVARIYERAGFRPLATACIAHVP